LFGDIDGSWFIFLWRSIMVRQTLSHRLGYLCGGACGVLAIAAGPAANAAFVPPDSVNLTVWLSADNGVTTDGSGLVSDWENQGVLTSDATQATAASRPLYVASDPAFNNQPSLSFDGSNDILRLSDASLTGTASGLTVFVVAQHRSAAASKGILGASNGDYGGSSQWFLMQSTSTSNMAEVHRNSSLTSTVNTGTLDTTGHQYEMIYDGGAQTLTQTVDGASSSTSAAFANVSYSILDIGGFWHAPTPPGSEFGAGDVNIAEILVYNTALSSADQATVADYLNNKYFPVPEPASLGLLAMGGLMLIRRKRK
jgi:hypothetical protein